MVGQPNVAPLRQGEPNVLGPYRLLGRIARGGMSTVYLGRHTDGGPPVAIKVIDDDLARFPNFRERFRREATAARRVARFCTAEVLDVDVSGPRPYLVTEFIDGPTLGAAVAAHGPMPPAELERFAIAVASALRAIHAAGVVHRDLKPGNVMLSSSGARVIDFGVCRPEFDDATAITWGRLGTPVFMSPEQARDEPATAASDIHAWGAIVIFAATGRVPFGDPGLTELLRRVTDDPPDLTGVPETLRPLVARAMAKDPANRPTARDLLLRLTDPDPAAADVTVRLPPGVAALVPLPTPIADPRAPARSPVDPPERPPAPTPPRAPRRSWRWSRRDSM